MPENDVYIIKQKLDECLRKMDEIDESLRGNINSEKPGIIHRLSIVEEFVKCQKRLSWFVLSTFIGAILLGMLHVIKF